MGEDLLSVRGRGSLLKSLSQDSEYSLDSSLFDAEEFLRDMGFAGAADPSIPDRFLPSLLQRLSRFPEAEMDCLHHRIVQSIGCFRRKEGKRRLFRNLSSGTRSPHLPCPSYPLLRSNTGPAAFPSSPQEVPHSPIAILVSAASTEDSSQFDSGQASVDLEDSEDEDDPRDSGCFSVVAQTFHEVGDSPSVESSRTTDPPSEEVDSGPRDSVDREVCSVSDNPMQSDAVSSSEGKESSDARFDKASNGTNYFDSCQNDSRAFHRPVERQIGKNFRISDLDAVSKGLENANPDAIVIEQNESVSPGGYRNLSNDLKSCETTKNSHKPLSDFCNVVIKASELACKNLEQEKPFKDSVQNTKHQTDCLISHNDALNSLDSSISAKDSLDSFSTSFQQTVREWTDIPSNREHFSFTAKDYADTSDVHVNGNKEVVHLKSISEDYTNGLQQLPTEYALDEMVILLSDNNMQIEPKVDGDNFHFSMTNSAGKYKTHIQPEKDGLSCEVKRTNVSFLHCDGKDETSFEISKARKTLKNPIRTNMGDNTEALTSLDSAISSIGSFNGSSDGNAPIVKHPLRRTSNSNNFYFFDSYPSSDRDSKEIKESSGEWSSIRTSLRSSFEDGSERSKSPVSDYDSAVECLSPRQKDTKGDSLASFLSSMLDTTGKEKRDELSQVAVKASVPTRKRRVLKRMSSSMQCCDEDDCRHHDGLTMEDSSAERKPEESIDETPSKTVSPSPVDTFLSSETAHLNSSYAADVNTSVTDVVVRPKINLRNTISAPLTSNVTQSPFKVNFSSKSSDFYRRRERRSCKRRRYLSCPSPNDFNFVPKFHNTKEFSSSLRDLHSPYRCQEPTPFSDDSITPRPGFYSPRGCSPVPKFRSFDPPWTSSFPSRLSSKGHFLHNSSPDVQGTLSPPELVRTFRFHGTSPSDEVFHRDDTCGCRCDSLRKQFRFPLRQNSMSYPDSEAPFVQQCLDRCCSSFTPSERPGHFSPERHQPSEFSESHFQNDDALFLKTCQKFPKRQVVRKISAPNYPFRSNACRHDYNYPKLLLAQNDCSRGSDVTHQPSCLHQDSTPIEIEKTFCHYSSPTCCCCRPVRPSSDILDCRCQDCLKERHLWRFSNLREGSPSGHSEASRQHRTSDVFCEHDRFSSGHFHSESLPETPYKMMTSHSDSELNECSLSTVKSSSCKHLASNQQQLKWDGFFRRRKNPFGFDGFNSQATEIYNPSGEKTSKASGPVFQFTSRQNRTALSNFEKPLSLNINSPKIEPVSASVKNSNPFEFELDNLNYSQFETHLGNSIPPKDNPSYPSRTEKEIVSNDFLKDSTHFSSKERNPNCSEPKAKRTNSSLDHNFQPSLQKELSENLLQIMPKHTILKRSISENPPSPSLSSSDLRSKSSPPSPGNKREAMFEKKIRIFSKFLTNLGNLSKSSEIGTRSLSTSLPDNNAATDSRRRCVNPPPVLSFHHPPMFETRVHLEADGDRQPFQPVLYTSTMSMFVNSEEDDPSRKRDESPKSNPKNCSSLSSPKSFNVVSKELEELQISIQKAKEMRLSASKELHLLQALLSREEPTKEKRCENSLENLQDIKQLKNSETLQKLKNRPRDDTEEAVFWQREVERARKETEEAWAEKLSRMSAQLSLQEAELQRLQKGISTESLQDAILCQQCNSKAATEILHHNGRTDSAFEDDEEYKPSIPIQSTRQECERLRERLTEEEQRADQLNLMLNQKIIEFNKLQLTLSKQTKEMIELEKSYLQLQCRMRRGSHRPRLCSREGLVATRGHPSPPQL